MTTAVDTNILIALWSEGEKENRQAQTSLDRALSLGPLVIAGPVFAELMAYPSRQEQFLVEFFATTGIAIDWDITEKIWRAAGLAFQQYAGRRKHSGSPPPRRILADFVIGAHAAVNRFSLLTLDRGFYQTGFPGLKIVVVPE